jgi:hypothetical protein
MNDALPCPKCGGKMRRGFLGGTRSAQHLYCSVDRLRTGEPVNAEIFGIKGVDVDVRN